MSFVSGAGRGTPAQKGAAADSALPVAGLQERSVGDWPADSLLSRCRRERFIEGSLAGATAEWATCPFAANAGSSLMDSDSEAEAERESW